MDSILIKNTTVVNEGIKYRGHILIENGKFSEIYTSEYPKQLENKVRIVDGTNKILIPGVIDDQVHFREPGFTHKEKIETGAIAAVVGGVTSFMEMPNTNPPTITNTLLQEKMNIAAQTSLANYSFYLGATNNNIEEIVKVNPQKVCGIKIFMGASTGNMLVDNENSLEKIFAKAPIIVTTHCEDEATIQKNIKKYRAEYGENVPVECHPKIRSEEACYISSSLAIKLAKKYGTRLHLLHISTAKELNLLDNTIPLSEKKITAEVCVHHLWFSDKDYKEKGAFIKWNPAVKTEKDRDKLLEGLLNNKLDVIATDHAPHTQEEKNNTYFKSPSGGPLLQHSLLVMLELYKQEKISLETIVYKMCHSPSQLFNINKRGFIRKGYYADCVLLDLNQSEKVSQDNIVYKCGWSPFEKTVFSTKVIQTYVNGQLVYDHGKLYHEKKGMQLEFNR